MLSNTICDYLLAMQMQHYVLCTTQLTRLSSNAYNVDQICHDIRQAAAAVWRIYLLYLHALYMQVQLAVLAVNRGILLYLNVQSISGHIPGIIC